MPRNEKVSTRGFNATEERSNIVDVQFDGSSIVKKRVCKGQMEKVVLLQDVFDLKLELPG